MSASEASVIVTLLTDFGTADGYVGAMKGVIAARAPGVRIVDLTHEIPAGNVRAGAYALSAAAREFPPGTVHVAVVDPGVGSERAAVAVNAGGSWFVGPDNGLLSWAVGESYDAYLLNRSEHYRRPDPSPTFHGRDVFAPLAAALARGEAAASVATPLGRPVQRLPKPVPRREGDRVTGSVVHVDRFGNLITNLAREDLPPAANEWTFHVGDIVIRGLSRTYSDVSPGQFVALVGSGGTIEISVRDGSAEEHSGAEDDEAVIVESA